MVKTDLSKYDNSWYHPGAGVIKRILWFWVNAWIFRSPAIPFMGPKRFLLRLFGAKIGKKVVIKPSVNIKYPWNLKVGDYSWIGEDVWIDNLVKVEIGASCCISQGALLLTGNHNYKKESFDLMVGEIKVEDGAWVGAKSVVCPGVTCETHSVLSVGSVAVTDLKRWMIYQGNPAEPVRKRSINDPTVEAVADLMTS